MERMDGAAEERGREGKVVEGGGSGAVAGQPAGRSWRWAEPEGLGPLGLPPDVTVQLL